MEVLRVLSPRPGGRSPGSNLRPKSPAGKSPRSGGQENTPPPHPNMNLPAGIKSPSLSKSERLSVSIPKCNSVIMQEEEVASVDSLPHDPDSDVSVKVAVRVRSINVNDRIVRKLSDQALSIGDRAFNFNSVFGPQSTQEEIFNSIGVPLVQNALAGFNTSVVSYGQTGTGKTHTMWGPPSAMVNVCSLDAKLGLVPRFFHMLFSEIEKRQEGSKQKQINYQCRCSFLEIYNEQINDLLDPTQRDLQIREDTINGIHVENLTDEYVTCHEDISQILIKGLSNRKVGATSLNSKSSRSHVMFTFVLESWSKQTGSSNFSSSKSSIITFVDLAGQDKDEFEQKKKDCTKEERFVKKSLSRLGKLVNILSDRKDQKVSYLGSSLTYLLQDTLGGNSKVTFLCHISSDKRSKAATLSTLRFGERAKQIENKPVINEISEDDVNGLSDQIRQLKEELIRAKSSDKSPSENFKGFNARKNLNLLRASLNRTLILPSIETESDSETELESNEKEITEFCAQISNSCTNLDEISLNSPISNENNEIVQKLSEKELEPEPTLCSSPRISMKLRKSIVSPKGLGFIRVSKDEVANVRSSIQSTKLSPTESLAASLHRGLNIIEENNNNINNDDNKELIRKSFVSLSFEHLALKNQSIETVDLSHHTDSEADKSFICTVCKGENENKARDERSKREKELEALCAEQEAKIKHLTSLVELKTVRESVRNVEETKSIQESDKMTQDTEDCLLDKLRNPNPTSPTATDQSESDKWQNPNPTTTDQSESNKWLESESRWICLTEELRQDLDSNRRYAERTEAELAQEKKCSAELDDALKRAIVSHSKMVEHYADLQEAYSDLLERHRRVMESITSVQKAAQKAGKKTSVHASAFAAALAAELSVVRIDREKERAVLKEQNRRLRIQLRDTAEAVHAAGELLVRLREAEEALTRSEERNALAEQENQRLKKQMEKLKKKHVLDMATVKNCLLESRLPDSALEPYYRAGPDSVRESESEPTHDNQSWRAAFAPSFQE